MYVEKSHVIPQSLTPRRIKAPSGDRNIKYIYLCIIIIITDVITSSDMVTVGKENL